MRLTLSSAAAPSFTLEELLAGCARRGLAGLELVQGHAHGIAPESDPAAIAAARETASRHGIRIVAYRASPESLLTAAAARLSRLLDAPVVAPRECFAGAEDATNSSRGQMPRARRDDAARRALALFDDQGGRLLLNHDGGTAEIAAQREVLETAGAAGRHGLAWDASPSAAAPIDAPGVIEASGAWLCHIRLCGGGPEAEGQAGQGIGELLGRLALTGYQGALALAPSTPRYHTAWAFWLGRRGWGCGSKDEQTIPLTSTAGTEVA